MSAPLHRPAAPPRLAVRALRSAQAGPLSFEVAAGECLAIVGASGAGKSVLLRLLADLDPGEGEVLLDGVERQQWPAPRWRSMVVYQAAEPAWWAPTAAEHLLPAQQAAAAALLPRLQLAPAILQAELSVLSTGERQRLALMRSLVAGPRVLLLDEPAAALDGASTAALEAVLADCLAQGMAIVLVTHSEQQAARLAQRQLRMCQGRLEPA